MGCSFVGAVAWPGGTYLHGSLNSRYMNAQKDNDNNNRHRLGWVSVWGRRLMTQGFGGFYLGISLLRSNSLSGLLITAKERSFI